ncbi:hypothetical protein E2986_08826 [Frieseomelitta varia]|uniref:4-hydroxyphenylpyruvate dioxygenase n=1 Tax=Frieseomelitta varia TaxID=561572 RepID=A0A833RTF7_9HYME|nr:hypothetical protein E2986_08826 [Frieseomelitta varia]
MRHKQASVLSQSTTYTDKGLKPLGGKFLHFDHLKFWVGNAKQAASYYCARLGFEPLAYRGLETGSRRVASHVVKQNQFTQKKMGFINNIFITNITHLTNIIFVFESAYEPNNEEMASHLSQHGDGVRDIAFNVRDIGIIVKIAKEGGATIVKDIWEESDEYGTVKFATIRTYGDTYHTLIDRSKYKGFFLPGFQILPDDPFSKTLPKVGLNFIDHIVGNQPDKQMEPVAKWYIQIN